MVLTKEEQQDRAELELTWSVFSQILVISGNLSFGDSGVKIAGRAFEIFKLATRVGYKVGREPSVVGVAGASVYIASVLEANRRTQNEIAIVAKTSENVLRARAAELAICANVAPDWGGGRFPKHDPKRVPSLPP